MATRKIRLDGDDVLRKVCKPIEKMTPRLQTLIDDMYETMYATEGIGLAAPQRRCMRQMVWDWLHHRLVY